MGFDIQRISLADGSPEAEVVGAIMNRDHVGPEEAVLRALRGVAAQMHQKTPAEELIGAFSSPEDRELIDDAVAFSRRLRGVDAQRDFGL